MMTLLNAIYIQLLIQPYRQLMNIPLKNIIENIEQPLKSPRKMSPELTQRYKINKKYDATQLNNYIRAFRKEIELPINYQASIFLSKTPQRCLNHNNVITLFCLDDKKPLCVHCMYQAFSHKKHQVVPINKVTKILKQQLQKSLQGIASNILPKINQFKVKNQLNMAKIDKQISNHIFIVNKFYQDLISSINGKRNEHIKYCQQIWNKFKYEHQSFSTQFNKTLNFVQEKVKEISELNSEENLLFNHNIAFYLSKVDCILVPSIAQFPLLKTKQIQNKIQSISKELNQILTLDFKLLKTQERRRSLQKVQSLPKNQKFVLWKSRSPEMARQAGQSLNSKKIVHQRFSYKQIPKAPFTQRENSKQKNWLKKQKKQKDKPSFIFHKTISQQPSIKQQTTLHTNRIKSKKQGRKLVTTKQG